MADISKITLLDGQEYDIKDAVARAAIPAAATVFPSMDGVGSKGQSNAFARADHRHPTDTSQFCLDYQIGTEITAGQDLNNFTTIGNYYSNTTNVTNVPAGCNSAFKLIVIRNKSYRYQILFCLGYLYKLFIYYRGYDGTNWEDWQSLSNNLYKGSRYTISSGGFLNNYKTPGTYSCAPNTTVTSSPLDSSYGFTMFVIEGNDTQGHGCYQIIFPIDSTEETEFTANVYFRRYSSNASGTGWSDWVNLSRPTTVNGHTVLSDVPANAIFTDTTYTPASAAPGNVASSSSTGTSTNYARQDHTHGIDLATGDANGQVKIAGQNISVKGLGSLAYADSVTTVNGHTVQSDVPTNLAVNGLYYGECDTGASTAAKIVTLTNGDGFSLVEGAKICVKFANTNSASDPTLNVNSTGAKLIKRYGTTTIGTTAGISGDWSAGGVVLFVFDGTNWVEHYWHNNTYSSMTVAEYTAGTGTTARTITPARLKAAIKMHSAPDVYTATIPTTGWTTESYGAYIDVTFTGASFAADDTVFVDLNLSSDTNLQLINDSWACLLRATPTASSAVIRFKFREIPTVEIPVRAVVK